MLQGDKINNLIFHDFKCLCDTPRANFDISYNMCFVVIGQLCLIVVFCLCMVIKAVNEAAVFIDDSFRWGNGRDY